MSLQPCDLQPSVWMVPPMAISAFLMFPRLPFSLWDQSALRRTCQASVLRISIVEVLRSGPQTISVYSKCSPQLVIKVRKMVIFQPPKPIVDPSDGGLLGTFSVLRQDISMNEIHEEAVPDRFGHVCALALAQPALVYSSWWLFDLWAVKLLPIQPHVPN